MKIYLIGYRATGKSSVAKMLAEELDIEMISLDDAFTKEYGPITRFVEVKGWEQFRDIESQLLESTSSKDNAIVDCGGGVILKDKNRILLKTGICIWLQASVDTIIKRLAKDARTVDQRPSLTGRSADFEVKIVLSEREHLYREAADHIIATDDKAIYEIAGKIKRILTNNTHKDVL